MVSVYLLVACALVACCYSESIPKLPEDPGSARAHFEEFKARYNRKYESQEEEDKRLKVFTDNCREINRLNSERNGTDDATYDVNNFSDMTDEEFLASATGYQPQGDSHCSEKTGKDLKKPSSLPNAFDWRDKKAVTGVKNQGGCGSCWTFSTNGNLEGLYAIKHKELVTLSEQQLLDCSRFSDTRGCKGGWMSGALRQAINDGGVMLAKDYPYEGSQKTCRVKKDKVKVKVTDCHMYNFENEKELREAIVSIGPLAIVLDATPIKHYKSGVVKSCPCKALNHAVTLVAYNTGGNEQYWVVKNSWGTGWGEKGYIRLSYGSNTCGLRNSHVTSGVIA